MLRWLVQIILRLIMTIFISSKLHGSSHTSIGSDPIPNATEEARGAIQFAAHNESSATKTPKANDPRLSDSRTPLAHALSHQAGGGDVIKLDDLGAPDNNTDLNASISKHGLMPKGDNDPAHFWNGQNQLVSLPAGAGEPNTAVNVGSGVGIFKDKTGYNINLKTLVEGPDISIVPTGDNELTITYTGSLGGGGYGEGTVNLLHRVTQKVEIKNDDDERPILNYTLPANTLTANDMLEIEFEGTYFNDTDDNDDENFFMRLRIGGTIVWQDKSPDMTARSNKRPLLGKIRIANRNSQLVQFIGGRVTIGNAEVAAVGLSDLKDDELRADTIINATSSKVMTSSQLIQLTVQHESQDNNVSFVCDLMTVKLVHL